MTRPVPTDIRIWIIPLTQPGRAQRRRQARHELEQILSTELGAAVQDLGITRDAAGKPQLPDRLLNFNLSHSGEIAMIAVSRERAVGIDVERPRKFRNEAGMRRRICSERELAHLSELETSAASSELVRLWVRKEAAVKASGAGITHDLNGLDALDDDLDGGWRCVDLPAPAPGYQAAVAFRATEHE